MEDQVGKRKVLFVISNLYGGGAERVVSVWANDLADMGYDVSIILTGRHPRDYYLDDRVKVYTLAATYAEYKKMPRIRQFSLRRHMVKQVNPDYILSFLFQNQFWTALTTWGLKAKKIETVRNSPYKEIGQAGLLFKWLAMFCFKRAYRIIVQTESQQKFFSNNLQKKCVVIPNPVQPCFQNHYKTQFSDKVKKFIAVGRITSQKNYPLMLQAFISACKINAQISLEIYGRDQDGVRENFERLVCDNGCSDKIKFMGPSSDLLPIYEQADAFLMTSDYEGMPNALMEAMASRLVCISTDCLTGPSDLITNQESGYLVPVGDRGAVKKAILRVADMDRESRVAMGSKAREKVMAMCAEENSLSRLISILQ